MDRRDFIQTTASGALATIVGVPLLTALTGCSNVPMFKTSGDGSSAHIPFSAFDKPMNGHSVLLVQVDHIKHPIAVVRFTDEPPLALYAVCTHKHCSLDVELDGFSCPCHGSTFTMHGQVVNGPAKQRLQKLPIKEQGDHYIVSLDGL